MKLWEKSYNGSPNKFYTIAPPRFDRQVSSLDCPQIYLPTLKPLEGILKNEKRNKSKRKGEPIFQDVY